MGNNSESKVTQLGESESLDQRQVRRDRQLGLMPSHVQRREDGDALWAAFRRSVGLAWTGEQVRFFIAGWDAARKAGV